jgi:prepilin-type N-terminal cleavage/methylation domain-containing protein
MRSPRAFTIVEMLATVALIGILVAIAYPKLRRNSTQAVISSSMQLVRDLEGLRTRSLGSRRMARVVFDESNRKYSWLVDVNGDSLFNATDSSAAGPGMVGTRILADGVMFGRGGVSGDVPLYAGTGNVTFASSQLVFDDRGLTFPATTQGIVYLQSTAGTQITSAVSVSGAGSFRAWTYRTDGWK